MSDARVIREMLDALNGEGTEAALAWFAESGDAAGELRLAAALWRYCYLRGHYREGRGWLQSALARDVDAPPAVVARALHGAGALAVAICHLNRPAFLSR